MYISLYYTFILAIGVYFLGPETLFFGEEGTLLLQKTKYLCLPAHNHVKLQLLKF